MSTEAADVQIAPAREPGYEERASDGTIGRQEQTS
jgi:hypothetical protein